MTGPWEVWILEGAVAATPWLVLALAVERLGRSRLHPALLHAVLVVAALELLVPVGFVPLVPVDGPGGASGTLPDGSTSGGPVAPLTLLAASVWAGGAVLFWGTLFLRTRRLRARLAREATPDSRLRSAVADVAHEVGVRAPDAVLWDGVAGPFVVGPFRPLVVVPAPLARSLPTRRLRHLLLHELVHVRRRDLLWEAAWALVAGLFWVHPLVHPLRRRARALREACCDAEAAELDRPGPGGYRETLLLLGRAALCGPSPGGAAVASFARSHELLWRARVLGRTRAPRSRPRRVAEIAAVLLLVILGGAVGVPLDPAGGRAPGGAGHPVVAPSALALARADAEAALRAHRDGTGGSMQLRNAVFRLRNAAGATYTDNP